MRKANKISSSNNPSRKSVKGPLYLQVASDIEGQIRSGTLRVGDRVPSLRAIKSRWEVSTSTALQSYFWLENRGLIEARPRSGFYVRVPSSDLPPEVHFEPERSVARDSGLDARLGQLIHLRAISGALQLGAAVPSPDFYPVSKLNQIIRKTIREHPEHSCGYQFPPGETSLRRQIAKHASRQLGKTSWEEIIVTAGAMEGLTLSLRAVAKPGDVIAVESPSYFGILQLIKSLGMKTLEVPTDPRRGMDLDLLEQALRKKRVQAVIIISNCHNPLGFVLSDETKRSLAELSRTYETPIIEDDVFGDLAFDEPRPRTIKFYDKEGLVLLVSSFCKVLGPGYRIGWVHAGRWQATVEQLQFVSTVAAPSLPQHVISSFLESGGYERHLRRSRTTLADRLRLVGRAVANYFPPHTRVTRPAGGFLLWVQLPKSINALAVSEKALEQGIAVVPGPIFSTTAKFDNCLRLSCGVSWSAKLEESLMTLGRIATRTMNRRLKLR